MAALHRVVPREMLHTDHGGTLTEIAHAWPLPYKDPAIVELWNQAFVVNRKTHSI